MIYHMEKSRRQNPLITGFEPGTFGKKGRRSTSAPLSSSWLFTEEHSVLRNAVQRNTVSCEYVSNTLFRLSVRRFIRQWEGKLSNNREFKLLPGYSYFRTIDNAHRDKR